MDDTGSLARVRDIRVSHPHIESSAASFQCAMSWHLVWGSLRHIVDGACMAPRTALWIPSYDNWNPLVCPILEHSWGTGDNQSASASEILHRCKHRLPCCPSHRGSPKNLVHIVFCEGLPKGVKGRCDTCGTASKLRRLPYLCNFGSCYFISHWGTVRLSPLLR